MCAWQNTIIIPPVIVLVMSVHVTSHAVIAALWNDHVMHINSFGPGRCDRYIKCAIFNYILVTVIWYISIELVLKLMPQDLFVSEDTSALIWVMAWCLRIPNHYLYQC